MNHITVVGKIPVPNDLVSFKHVVAQVYGKVEEEKTMGDRVNHMTIVAKISFPII